MIKRTLYIVVVMVSAICFFMIGCRNQNKTIADEGMVVLVQKYRSVFLEENIQRIEYSDGKGYYFFYYTNGLMGIVTADLNIIKVIKAGQELVLVSENAQYDETLAPNFLIIVQIVKDFQSNGISSVFIDNKDNQIITLQRFDGYYISNREPLVKRNYAIIDSTWYIRK